MNLNKAIIVGRVTKDPEIRALPSGAKVASFSMATNRFYTDNQKEKKQETEFHSIVVFGKLADIAERYIKKGALLLVEGRIKTRNWVNTNQQKQYRTEIVADGIQMGPRPGGQKSAEEFPGGSDQGGGDSDEGSL